MSENWNNELKIDFTVVNVPSLYLPIDGPRIFLAGSIDGDNDNHWRKETISYIKKIWFENIDNKNSITIYNPLRDEEWSFDMEAEQAAWDISMLNISDYIIMNLMGDSVSPVSLLELGLFSSSSKLFLSIEDTYVRKNIAELYYSCYGYNRIYKNLQETVNFIQHDWIKKNRM